MQIAIWTGLLAANIIVLIECIDMTIAISSNRWLPIIARMKANARLLTKLLPIALRKSRSSRSCSAPGIQDNYEDKHGEKRGKHVEETFGLLQMRVRTRKYLIHRGHPLKKNLASCN